jgi:uncharacterized protein
VILIDAGPLVALADPADFQHDQCVESATALAKPFASTWPVIAEAAWLLRRSPHLFRILAQAFQIQEIALYSLPAESIGWMIQFMQRYADLGAQLADASLMYVAEHERIDTIFTLDRRDFSVYRTSRNRALKIVP